MTKFPTARILVIDDEPAVVEVLVPSLREEGYRASGALTEHAHVATAGSTSTFSSIKRRRWWAVIG
jgi:CheY-like chemotaxis protein